MTRESDSEEGSKPGTVMTGAEIFVRSLIEEKVEVLFGYP